MPDPAEKSDDLIAELAKLMSAPAPAAPAPTPIPQPAPPLAAAPPIPIEPAAPAAAQPAPASPIPVRIPGMESPRPAAAAPAPETPRGPTTGVIRIPGMSQPAPVAASAPVGKVDLSGPVPVASQPSFTSLADRIAARAAEAEKAKAQVVPPPAPAAPQAGADVGALRFPQLRTVSENKSFAQGPAISLPSAQPTPPPAPPPSLAPQPVAPVPAPAASDFTFDFGFSNPPAAKPAAPEANADPIAALINADMAQAPARPAPVIPVLRTTAPTPKPAPAPVAPAAPTPAPRQASAPIPLKPLNVSLANPEADHFSVPPDTGLNMRTPVSRPLSPPAPPRAPRPVAPPVTETDPMAEIESLIGEAVRVELNPGPVRVQAAQPVSAHVEIEPEDEVRQEIHSEPVPVVPPLSSQFAPRRSAIPDESHAAAEDAILQAAAATGAQVDRIEPSMAEERPYRRLKVKSQRSSYGSSGLRQYVGMAVAGTLLLAAGLGLYWVLNMGRPGSTSGAGAPQLTAATAQVKEVPKPQAKPVNDAAKSPVLQQMEGASQAPSTEQLVTTDQTAGSSAVAEKAVATADEGDDNSEGGLANRKVRTVTVRPDGTIVPGDDGVAGNEALPVERPNVPAVPSTETTNLLGSDTSPAFTVANNSTNTGASNAPLIPLANIPDNTTTATPATAAAVDDTQPIIDPTAVAPKPMSFPVKVASATPATTQTAQPQALSPTPKSSVNAVITGAQTPNGQIDLLGSDALAPHKATPAPQPTQVATTAPAPSTASGATAAAYVQLASSLSEAEANAAVKSQTARYGTLFGGSRLVVQQADLGSKGTRWRVRLPASSLADANAICAQIKAQGGDCFATNG